MSVASHGPERDTGHTGNFSTCSGPCRELLCPAPGPRGPGCRNWRWYFDFARRWDGSFAHQGPPAQNNDSYGGWDCTGAYLLAYAMPLKKIRLTGRTPGIVPELDANAAHSLLDDGRGWNNKDRTSAYDALAEEALLSRLGSWSPTVRKRAAMALARRKSSPIPALVKMLDAPHLEARYGACQALGSIKGAALAVPALQEVLQHEDLWLRVQAAEALAAIGRPAMWPCRSCWNDLPWIPLPVTHEEWSRDTCAPHFSADSSNNHSTAWIATSSEKQLLPDSATRMDAHAARLAIYTSVSHTTNSNPPPSHP